MTRGFRRILVAHDFSRDADRALVVAVDLARRHGGRLTVLHVASPIALQRRFPPTVTLRPPGPEVLAAIRARLERRLQRLLGRRRALPGGVRIVVGDPHAQIIAAARGHDLVVLGTQGLTGLDHLVIGSVAEKVVRHAPVPVLTVRGRRRGR